ncbi:hypothetical protein QTG54_002631 [Skeletonema marinoi]|uniref:Uncharacterized protein n=2 Tax=Skeletonema marinoi TaxID=267567 RepID=A0AAD8YJL0_9STRA|nr:hypothetical protein QTG54_002631 [Skeletonema marinoi]
MFVTNINILVIQSSARDLAGMGPLLYMGVGGAHTKFHEDGSGTVDSGHLCLCGFNEVIILRRLDGTRRTNAASILGISLEKRPHVLDTSNKDFSWPTVAKIEELKAQGAALAWRHDPSNQLAKDRLKEEEIILQSNDLVDDADEGMGPNDVDHERYECAICFCELWCYYVEAIPKDKNEDKTFVCIECFLPKCHLSTSAVKRGGNCRNLVSVEMHDRVRIIEKNAFDDCVQLKSIKLLDVRVIKDYAFVGTMQLHGVEFGEELHTIGHMAFAHSSLEYVKLPKVRVLNSSAFYACEKLVEAHLSEDLETIERFDHSVFNVYDDEQDLLDNDNGIYNRHALSRVDLVGGIHSTIASLHMVSWRNEMNNEINRINQVLPNIAGDTKTQVIQQWMRTVIGRLAHCKDEHHKLLKEATTLLELALWKANLDNNEQLEIEGVRTTRGRLKRARKESCVTSGASTVIKNVLPFLALKS